MDPIDLSQLPLDWTLARERFERDVRDDFFPDPLRNRDLFLAARTHLDRILTMDNYTCDSSESLEEPKANFSLRHCINITPVDRLVYQALVDHLTRIIREGADVVTARGDRSANSLLEACEG